MKLEKILNEIEKMDDTDKIDVLHKVLESLDVEAYAVALVINVPDGGIGHWNIKSKDKVRAGYSANELESTLEMMAEDIRTSILLQH